MKTFYFFTIIISSLVLFLFSLNSIRLLLQNKTSNKFTIILKSKTSNIHISFLLGIFLTIILTSSTLLTALIIVFLSSNTISKKSALMMILGSNIGTTITAFLFSFNANYLCLFVLFLSLVFKLLNKDFIYKILIYLTFALFSLLIINNEISNIPFSLENYIFSSPFLSFLEGIFFSIILNSSSTTIISTNILFTKNILSLSQGLSNVGTTINTILICIGQSKKCFDIILINIVFNIFFGILFLIYLNSFTNLISLFYSFLPINILIPLSHFIFNLISTLVTYLLFIYIKI